MADALILLPLGLLALAALGLLVYWSAVAFHVARTVLRLPNASHGLRANLDPSALPTVAAIVPAHNEAACIADIAATLARQDYPAGKLRLIFSLDRCTDETRAVLEATLRAIPGALSRAEIIDIDHCPPGWVGKSHALWAGVQRSVSAADSDLLLFVDADTRLDPRLVTAAVGLMHQRGLEMLSLLSTLTYDRWFEGLVQPAAGMELMRQYPLVRANDPVRRRPFANGQFILVRRELYHAVGGHQAIRDAVLEDVELARRCHWNKSPCGFFLDGGMLGCRMYDSYGALRRGWKRIYGECANRKPARLRRISRRIRLVSTLLPVAGVAAIIAGAGFLSGPHPALAQAALALGVSGLVVWLGVITGCYALGRIPLRWVVTYPIGAWITGGILSDAARDLEQSRPTVWGGIEFDRAAR